MKSIRKSIGRSVRVKSSGLLTEDFKSQMMPSVWDRGSSKVLGVVWDVSWGEIGLEVYLGMEAHIEKQEKKLAHKRQFDDRRLRWDGFLGGRKSTAYSFHQKNIDIVSLIGEHIDSRGATRPYNSVNILLGRLVERPIWRIVGSPVWSELKDILK